MNNLNLEVFNYKELLERFMDETEVVNEVLDIYVEKVEKQLITLDEKVKEADFEKIKFESHNIKGGALNLSAKRLASEAKNLEDAAKKREKESTYTILLKLKAEFQAFKVELNNNGFNY